MHWIDNAIILLVMISALVGWMRGIVRELLSFVTWMMSLVLAWLFHRDVAQLLSTQLAQPSLRIAIAFTGLMFVGLIIGTILTTVTTKVISKVGLTRVNHIIGLLFGMLRGLIIVAMLVFLAALTPLPTAAWWQESTFISYLLNGANWFVNQIPADVRERLKQL
ncbi:CvpA family protein [Chromatium okenii]|jgi:membrane protein required for colicin V production|uniref:CvpA family protein n=1 Tax=Chromatium okenii TaxID=61644 RepID=UPI0026F2B513|nr:CvpA family protein [Chromatium okenii]MBV5310198.1 CvpA family protein [Chromatium okenii]